jgi:hypothetical protein
MGPPYIYDISRLMVKCKYYSFLLMANYPYSNCNAGNNPKIRFIFSL